MFTTSLSLLERLRDPRDEPAWRQLVTLYTPLLRSWLRPHCRQEADADDLTQEVLTVLAQKVRDFAHNHRMGAFRTYLRTIAAHKLGDYLRSARRAPLLANGEQDRLLEQLEDPASDLSQIWERQHDQHVAQALLELIRPQFTAATWQAFHCLVVEGQPTAQVAAALGLTSNAVLIAKSRVLARLRQEWRCWQGD
jgi:RNA polymerase sigma-70 factor (ECF subfamily)